MSLKKGDKVRVKSIEDIDCTYGLTSDMERYAGRLCTVAEVCGDGIIRLKEDKGMWNWSAGCFVNITGNTMGIDRVIFNNPATIVIWDDGTKTVVKCQNDEPFDKEKGIALCFMKKHYGNKSSFNEVFHKFITEEDKEEYKPKHCKKDLSHLREQLADLDEELKVGDKVKIVVEHGADCLYSANVNKGDILVLRDIDYTINDKPYYKLDDGGFDYWTVGRGAFVKVD